MFGGNEPFDVVPFFRSAHCDTQVLYVGHAGDLGWMVSRRSGLPRCVLERRPNTRSGDHDLDSLRAELEFEAAGPAQ